MSEPIVNKLPEPEPLKLLAMRGKIVVERIRDDRVGSLYLPQTARDRSTLGRVVSVYDPFYDPTTLEDVEPFIQVGDVVIFGGTAGVEIQINDRNRQTYVVLREAEVLCKVANFPEKEGSSGE